MTTDPNNVQSPLTLFAETKSKEAGRVLEKVLQGQGSVGQTDPYTDIDTFKYRYFELTLAKSLANTPGFDHRNRGDRILLTHNLMLRPVGFWKLLRQDKASPPSICQKTKGIF